MDTDQEDQNSTIEENMEGTAYVLCQDEEEEEGTENPASEGDDNSGTPSGEGDHEGKSTEEGDNNMVNLSGEGGDDAASINNHTVNTGVCKTGDGETKKSGVGETENPTGEGDTENPTAKEESVVVTIDVEAALTEKPELYLYLIMTIHHVFCKAGILCDVPAELTAKHVERLVFCTVEKFKHPVERMPSIGKYKLVARDVFRELKKIFGNKMKTMLIMEDMGVEDIIASSIQKQTVKWLDKKARNYTAIIISSSLAVCITLIFAVAAIVTGGFSSPPFSSVFVMLTSLMAKI